MADGTQGHNSSLNVLLRALELPLQVRDVLVDNLVLVGSAHLTKNILREHVSLLAIVEAGSVDDGGKSNMGIGLESLAGGDCRALDHLENLLKKVSGRGLDSVGQA